MAWSLFFIHSTNMIL